MLDSLRSHHKKPGSLFFSKSLSVATLNHLLSLEHGTIDGLCVRVQIGPPRRRHEWKIRTSSKSFSSRAMRT